MNQPHTEQTQEEKHLADILDQDEKALEAPAEGHSAEVRSSQETSESRSRKEEEEEKEEADDLSDYPYAPPRASDSEEEEISVDEETGEIKGLEPPEEGEDVKAFIARKEKGVQKLVHRYQQKLAEAENLLASPTAQILAYAQAKLGENPSAEDVKAVWTEIRRATEAAYGIDLSDDTKPARSRSYEEDAYGNVVIDGVSFDKDQVSILQKLITQGVEMGMSQLKTELLPALKFVESQQQQVQLEKAARQVVPLLKRIYHDFVTEERVLEAIRAKPGYDPIDAFKAHFADELAMSAYKAGKSKASKDNETRPRNMFKEENLGTLDELKREWDEPVPLAEIVRRLPVR